MTRCWLSDVPVYKGVAAVDGYLGVKAMSETKDFEYGGWRGYALPKLQTRYNAVKSSLLLGIVWGLWHLPFVVYLNYSWGVVVGTVTSLFYAFYLVPSAIIYTWFYNNTESVLISILFHTAGNVTNTHILGTFTHPIMGTILPFITTVAS